MKKDEKMLFPLETMRHSAAHLLAAAVLKLHPKAKLGVGPVIENGFYYDFDLEETISAKDFPKIEKMMQKIKALSVPYTREELSIEQARAVMSETDQIYKLELLNDIEKNGTTKVDSESIEAAALNGTPTISIYRTGDFVDLCQGPHVDNTNQVGVFKLMSVAGAYWRGSEKNKMLQRVYGVAFQTQEELDAHIYMLEEAERRDHRKLGKEQELFHIDELVGKGLVLWLPKGAMIKQQVENLAIEMENKEGYDRVTTPHIAKQELFLTSGHLPYYKDGMYPEMVMDDGTYYLKAMNCPHHHIIYRHKPRSYRELPVRLAEYGTVYRNELSGTLAGLLRVRAMSMNDAHIYCRKDQIKKEFKSVMEMTMREFTTFGLTDYWFRLSKWSPEHTDKYINQPENWEYSQQVLREVLDEMKVTYREAEDEAAFYGPKVDVQFKSVIGREETMSTIQLDFLAKERFELSYTDETGSANNEVFVIHRAPLSTHERFMAFLIEHYAGSWPTWLAPVQVAVIPVGKDHVEPSSNLAAMLQEKGIRTQVDDSNETVGYKIRKAEKSKVPYMLVVGDKEANLAELSVRARGQQETVAMSPDEFIGKITSEIINRTI